MTPRRLAQLRRQYWVDGLLTGVATGLLIGYAFGAFSWAGVLH